MSNKEEIMLNRFHDIDETIDAQEADLTPIQEFYKNSNVFITGATGFLGNILVEKLLRSCPVSTLYLLVRNKKGKDTSTRLDEIFDDPLFQRLRKLKPNFRDKVVAVEGDCLLPDLGLSLQDKALLVDKVDIIFHVAATVRFDEKLNKALSINVRSTRDISRLAQRMPRLKSLVHVSTAYSNCILEEIEEKIYPPPADYEQLISIVENLPENVLESMTPSLLGDYPNTYTFTKQLAENAIKKEAKSLPAGIYRPAIVVSTSREPVRGWINNLYGPTGIVVGAGFGIVRLIYCDPERRMNMVPVDLCVNALIAAAWDISEKFKLATTEKSDYEVQVYNYEGNDKPFTYRSMKELSSKYYCSLTTPIGAVWYCSFNQYKNYYVFLLLNFLLHTLPAIIADGILFCMGKEPRMKKLYDKIYKANMGFTYFNTREWNFISENVNKFIDKMTDRDRRIFFCSMKELVWDDFFKTYTLGARVYLCKESIIVPQTKPLFKRLYWMHQITKLALGLLALWILRTAFSFIFELDFFSYRHSRADMKNIKI